MLFDPAARRTIRATELHHSSDFTPFEGRQVQGTVRSLILRGSFVVRDRAFVGRRGFGRIIERAMDGLGWPLVDLPRPAGRVPSMAGD